MIAVATAWPTLMKASWLQCWVQRIECRWTFSDDQKRRAKYVLPHRLQVREKEHAVSETLLLSSYIKEGNRKHLVVKLFPNIIFAKITTSCWHLALICCLNLTICGTKIHRPLKSSCTRKETISNKNLLFLIFKIKNST